MVNIANKITVARIFAAPLYIVIMLVPIPYREFYAALLFVIAASTDFLDGYLARKSKTVTTFGKFLDPLADKLLVSAALITLAWFKLVGPLAAFTIISREFAVTGLRVIASGQGQVIAASKLGKIKTFSQIVALTAITLEAGLAVGESWLHHLFSYLPIAAIAWVSMAVALALTVLSGLDYFIKNLKVLKKGF